MSPLLAAEDILAAAEEIKAAGECSPKAARDPVNLPMINNWVEAMGDANPVYVDEAPPGRPATRRGWRRRR